MASIKQKSNDEWRSKRSQEQIAAGGLPLNAEWRLRQLTEDKRLFTSFLSVSELALTSSIGLRPLGQVLGSSAFHVGWRPQAYFKSVELTEITQAYNRARRLALSRLQQEADTLGARAVLHVRLEERSGIDGNALLEISASGTAVTWQEARPPLQPVLCAISGQELTALRQGGYWPVGLALGTCVYSQIGSRNTASAMGNPLLNSSARTNQELWDYTEGFSLARKIALERLAQDAAVLWAEGVVGTVLSKSLQVHEVELEINEQKIKRRDLHVHFSVLGTAIRPFADHIPPIFPVMPLGS